MAEQTWKERMEERLHELYRSPKSIEDAQKRLDMTRMTLRQMDDFHANFIDRRKFCIQYGFTVPSTEMIDLVNAYGKIVEVGAGTGHMASLMNDCIATDPMDGEYGFEHDSHVEQLTALEAVEKYPDRVILCCWPTYEDEWAYNMARHLDVGRILIYVGEDSSGCTAEPKFHKFLYDHCKEVEILYIPNWPGIHDWLRVYQVESKDES